eukprot:COSAG06_NODE_57312_length_280_cov_6.839779_1_plen_33_part_10
MREKDAFFAGESLALETRHAIAPSAPRKTVILV